MHHHSDQFCHRSDAENEYSKDCGFSCNFLMKLAFPLYKYIYIDRYMEN